MEMRYSQEEVADLGFTEAYRNWLLGKADMDGYRILFDWLYDTEFEWDDIEMPMDANREADARYLRQVFADEVGYPCPRGALDYPASFMEVLVALAIRIESDIMYDPENDQGVADWFWIMMHNADLDKYTDSYMMEGGTLADSLVAERVNAIMARRYDADGHGGLFPFPWGLQAGKDARDMELWAQCNEYFYQKYFGPI